MVSIVPVWLFTISSYWWQNILSSWPEVWCFSRINSWSFTMNYCRPFPLETTRSQSQKRLVNLGVMFDENLTSMSQINLICKKAMLAMRSIGCIKKYLSKDHLARLVNAFVIPHLGYCNSVLLWSSQVSTWQASKGPKCRTTSSQRSLQTRPY